MALLAGLAAPAAAQGGARRALDEANLDTTCAPCRDFYQWSNGGWLARNPVPAAYGSWGSFDELRDKNQAVLRSVLEEAATNLGRAPAGSNAQKLGVFYAACMDSASAERAGAAPLADALARINRIDSRAALQAQVTRLQGMGLGGMFGFSAQQDAKNSTRVIAVTSQGGLGLPDRDYYTRPDSAAQKIRAAYREHVARMLVLTGATPAQAAADAGRVLAIETAMANASMTRVAQRDPNAVYNKMSVAQLQALTPGWQWATYMRDRGARGVDSVNVRQPDFFRALDGMLTSVPLADWKAYLRWHLARSAAPALSSAFGDESFRMQAVLTGTREQLPRWKRCLANTDAALGEALGQAYVERTFTPEAKARALRMVDNLAAALRDRLGGLEWMTDTTRAQALAKLGAFRNKIGYPDRWRDYSALELRPGSHLDNLVRVSQFASARNFAKIGQPVDRNEWGMTPPTVNAYYSPSMNEIVFPAGILQPPFFDPAADDAVNYGGMGAVIGHEMTHGFDDQGRQFDAAGNLRDWWQPRDAAAYTEQA
ncbi:MAG TPA: M13 family metallopeptidase, partial [Longimicrobium sp.]